GRSPNAPADRAPRDPRLEVWLQSLSVTATPAARRAMPSPERLLFSIALEHRDASSPIAQLRVERAAVEPDGTFGPRRIVNPAHLDWSRDPAVAPGDHALVLRMGAFAMGYIVLAGTPGARILSDVVATGRAFFETGAAAVRLATGGTRE